MSFWRTLLSPARRRRRRIVWTTATAIVAGVWGSSGWLGHLWPISSAYAAGIVVGQAVIVNTAGAEIIEDYSSAQFHMSWGPTLRARPLVVSVPIWMVACLMLIPTSRSWLAKVSPSSCPRCGYDLAGLAPGAACPECGAVAERKEAQA